MTPDYLTQVNGHVFDFSSIKLLPDVGVLPFELQRFVSIDYEHSLEVGELRGEGPRPLGDGDGEYRTRASLTMYLSEWRELRTKLAALPGPGGWMQKKFNVRVQYAEEGETAVEDELRGCRVVRASKAYRRGSEPLLVALDLFVTEIIEGGARAVALEQDDDFLGTSAAFGD